MSTQALITYQRLPDCAHDDAEVQVCVVLPDTGPDNNELVEVVADEATAEQLVADGEARRWFYSVYWHRPEGGVNCVGDCQTREDAESLYNAMMCAVAVQRGDFEVARKYSDLALVKTQ